MHNFESVEYNRADATYMDVVVVVAPLVVVLVMFLLHMLCLSFNDLCR